MGNGQSTEPTPASSISTNVSYGRDLVLDLIQQNKHGLGQSSISADPKSNDYRHFANVVLAVLDQKAVDRNDSSSHNQSDKTTPVNMSDPALIAAVMTGDYFQVKRCLLGQSMSLPSVSTTVPEVETDKSHVVLSEESIFARNASPELPSPVGNDPSVTELVRGGPNWPHTTIPSAKLSDGTSVPRKQLLSLSQHYKSNGISNVNDNQMVVMNEEIISVVNAPTIPVVVQRASLYNDLAMTDSSAQDDLGEFVSLDFRNVDEVVNSNSSMIVPDIPSHVLEISATDISSLNTSSNIVSEDGNSRLKESSSNISEHSQTKTGQSSLISESPVCNPYVSSPKMDATSNFALTGIGETALHCAVSMGFADIAKLLISYNADVTAFDRVGRSPLFLAIIGNMHVVLEDIMDHIVQLDIDKNGEYNSTVDCDSNEDINAILNSSIEVGGNTDEDADARMQRIWRTKREREKALLKSRQERLAKRKVNNRINVVAMVLGLPCCRWRREWSLYASNDEDIRVTSSSSSTTSSHRKSSIQSTPLKQSKSSRIVESPIGYDSYDNSPGEGDLLSPLHAAIRLGRLEIVRMLTRFGGKAGIFEGQRNALSILQGLTTVSGDTPVHDAIGSPLRRRMVPLLLDIGASVNCANKFGNLPLHYACDIGDWEVAERLMMMGVATNVVNLAGETPLHRCASGVHADFIKGSANVASHLLQNHSGDPDAPTIFGRTPLHYAAYYGHIEVAQSLLDQCAVCDVFDCQGLSPLHAAVYQGHLELVKLLLKHGANPDAIGGAKETFVSADILTENGGIGGDKDGLHHNVLSYSTILIPTFSTPLSLARSGDDDDLVEVLKRGGATIVRI